METTKKRRYYLSFTKHYSRITILSNHQFKTQKSIEFPQKFTNRTGTFEDRAF